MPLAPGGFVPFGIKTLEELAPRLASRASAFTLHVSDGYSERILYACGSGVYVFSVGERSGTGVAGSLVKMQKLDEAEIEEAQARCRDEGIGLRDALLARGSIAAEEYDDIARRVVLDEVLDLAFWEDALYSTYEAPPPTEFFAAEAHVDFADLAPGAIEDGIASWIRKWQAWKPILRADDTPLRLEPEGSQRAVGSPDSLAALLRVCRKSGTIRSIRRETDLRLIEICDRVCGAIDAGFLSITAEAPPPPSTRQSIEKLEKTLPLALGKDLIRLKLASVCRRAGEPDRACAHLETVADQAASRGDRALAMDCLRSILSIRPGDTAALRSLVEIQTSRGLAKEAIQTAMQVEGALLRDRKTEPMRAVAEILGELGDTLAVREVNADLRTIDGNHEEALEEYCILVDRHEAARDFDRAVQALGKAVQIAGDDEDLKTRLVRLKQRARGTSPPPLKTSGPKPAPVVSARPAPSRGLTLESGALVLLVGAAALALAFLAFGRRLEVVADGEPGAEVLARPDPDTDPADPAATPRKPGVVDSDPEPRSEAPVDPAPPRRPPVARAEARPADPPRVSTPPTTRAPASRTGTRAAAKEPAPLPVTRGTPPAPRQGLPLPAPAPAPAPAPTPAPTPTPTPTPAAPDLLAKGGAASAAEAKSLSPEELLRDALPPRPCAAHGLHRTILRALPRGRRILLADGCFLRIEDAATQELILECEGKEGTHWAYDASGEVICRWSPGQPLRGVTVDTEETWLPEGWELPEDAEAVAVGIAKVGVLERSGTRIVRFPEKESTFSTRTPRWKAGFFTDGMLVIDLEGGKAGGGSIAEKRLALDPRTLDPIALPPPGPEKPPVQEKRPDGGDTDRGSGSAPREPVDDRAESRGTDGSPEG